MKSQRIFIALSNADDTLVERAAESMSKKRKNLFFIPVVAVIVTLVLTASAIAFSSQTAPRAVLTMTTPSFIESIRSREIIPRVSSVSGT